jgi:hypothetical protein
MAAATVGFGSIAQTHAQAHALTQPLAKATDAASCSPGAISPTALVVGAGAPVPSSEPVWVAVGE